MSTYRFSRPRGFNLIELIVFIVVVGIAVAGVAIALQMSTRASVDPLAQKQALAIAEGLLEEVQLQAFTFCDPDDANAGTALTSADCTGGTGGANDENGTTLGPEGETRTSTISPFDNVSDYNGLALNPITTINGTAITGVEGYSASIAVTRQGMAGPGPAIPAAEALLITVTVTGPSATTVRLDGYRTRYAPNALP